MRDSEPVGLKLAALARLDGELRVSELDAVVAEKQCQGNVPPDAARPIEPPYVLVAEERVRDRERNRSDGEQRGQAKDVLSRRGQRVPDAPFNPRPPLVENVNRDVRAALRGKQP